MISGWTISGSRSCWPDRNFNRGLDFTERAFSWPGVSGGQLCIRFFTDLLTRAMRSVPAPGLRSVLMLLVIVTSVSGSGSSNASEVTVFAAASLKNALDEIVDIWSQETGYSASVSYAGSSELARQIRAGAPADVFFSADQAWMDTLQEAGLIAHATRFNVVGNRLVVIRHRKPDRDRSGGEETIATNDHVRSLFTNLRVALAQVDAVPAGRYAKHALVHLGWWDIITQPVIQTTNVRGTLRLVATGEADLGIVYASDAGVEHRVTKIWTIPARTHPAITYPAAILRDRVTRESLSLVHHLRSERARAVLIGMGFCRPDPAAKAGAC